MKKIRLYLDTSVVSALADPKKPERMQETHLLWKDIKADKYEIIISFVLIDEVEKCKQPKRDIMYDFLSTIKYEKLEANDTISDIADEVFKLGILPKKSRNDRLHIGSAIVSSCNYIVSWNFKHLVKIKTVNGVRAITNLHGFNPIDIIAPASLIY
ncbi:MAG: PIN domain nuclease [Candidatus Cloacimonetes bacterium]|nr:PIN domain nuclease [Candidatus Cloacimonadota bacterium]